MVKLVNVVINMVIWLFRLTWLLAWLYPVNMDTKRLLLNMVNSIVKLANMVISRVIPANVIINMLISCQDGY